jgi:hypothetical protein
MKSKIFKLYRLNHWARMADNLELLIFISPSVLLPTKMSNKYPLVCLVCPGSLRPDVKGPTFVTHLTENTNYEQVTLGTLRYAGNISNLFIHEETFYYIFFNIH